MILKYPIDHISAIPPIDPNPQSSIYISQGFGANPVFPKDTVINGTTYKKGTSVYAQFGLKGHDGLDIACPTGTPVKAAHGGVLSFSKDVDGYGNDATIVFETDGFTYQLIYGHLQRYEGKPRTVVAGEVIAYADTTGFATGPHLHFGVRKLLNGIVLDYSNGYLGYLDPMIFLKGSEMILLKADNDQTVFIQSADTLIGFDSMASYTKFTEGRNPVIVVMPAAELAKFIKAPVVIKL